MCQSEPHFQGALIHRLLHTFSYIADDPRINEEHYISIAANAAKANLHTIQLNSNDLVNDIEKLIATQGEPFGSTSIYAQYRVFQLAKTNGIKVMLDGQGADELLAGYRPYIASRLATLLGEGNFIKAAGLLANSQKLPGSNPFNLLLKTIERILPANLHHLARQVVGEDFAPPWLNGSWFLERGVQMQSPRKKGLRRILIYELQDALKRVSLPALLRYEDHNSMAHSIESRVPFLNHTLAEFIFSLPENFLIDDRGIGKSVFREAMRGIVSDTILDRRDKIGFATPELDWLAQLEPWITAMFQSSEFESLPLQNNIVQAEFRQTLAHSKKFDWKLWRWINLSQWTKITGAKYL
jgi:asparagine synthase (glutamine-hydrolysing)